MDERPEMTVEEKVRIAIDTFLNQPVLTTGNGPQTDAEIEDFLAQRVGEGTAIVLAALGLEGGETKIFSKKEDPTEVAVEPMVYAMFEDNIVTAMEGVLPLVTMEMMEGYKLGTHIRFEFETRVANIRYEEGKGKKRGDFIRRHMLTAESVTFLGAFLPGEADTAATGTLADSSSLVEDEEPEFEEPFEEPTVERVEEQVEPESEIMDAPVGTEPELSLSERISAAAEAERLANPPLPTWATHAVDPDEVPF